MVWYYATRTSRHNIEHLHNTKKGREGRVGDGTNEDVDETDDVGVSDAHRIQRGNDGRAAHATYANVSRVPSTRSMYSFSSRWSIA